jgi:transposase-like protein
MSIFGANVSVTAGVPEQSACLVIETGRPIAHVAKEIGVGEQLLGQWVARRRHEHRVTMVAHSARKSASNSNDSAARTPNHA